MAAYENLSFQDPAIENPFIDPGFQEAALKKTEEIKLEDYDPFEKFQQLKQDENEVKSSVNLLAYENVALPKVEKSINLTELQRRQEEIERKEQALKIKEYELKQGIYNYQKKNWPPFPQKCFLKPCFYQDIQCDIPYEFQKVVLQLYRLWLIHECVMIANIFGGIITLNPSIIGVGIMYMILYTPFSYICWFRPAYKAFRSDSSIHFVGFFIMFALQLAITTIQAVGLPGSGSIGLIYAIRSFGTYGVTTCIFLMLIAFGFCTAAALDFLMISKVHRIYKSTGASFAKAQEEFFKSGYVSNATSSLLTSQFGSRN